MDVLSFNKEINRLRKEINRLLSKRMLNIYLKVTIEANSPGQFLGSSNSRRYQWILKLLVQLKNQRFGSKTVGGFSIILILKVIMTF